MHIKNALKTLANRLTKNYTSPSPTASQGTSAPPGATVKPPVIITTRFSHWDPKAKNSWRIGRVDDEEQYKKALFDEKRLAAKFSIFEQVTLPSIAGQSDLENVYLTLVTSEDLPEPFKKRLRQIESSYSWLSVDFVPPDGGLRHTQVVADICQKIGAQVYAHSRLDDDDAISKDYAARIRRYIRPEFVGFGFSFSRGYTGYYDESRNTYHSFYDFYAAKSSCGLACISDFKPDYANDLSKVMTAYKMGDHTKIDRRRPVIMDGISPGFIYSQLPSQDTANARPQPKTATVPPEEVEKYFTLNRAAFHPA